MGLAAVMCEARPGFRSSGTGDIHEPADGPAGLLLDPPADCQRGEHDREVGFDGVPVYGGRSAGPEGEYEATLTRLCRVDELCRLERPGVSQASAIERGREERAVQEARQAVQPAGPPARIAVITAGIDAGIRATGSSANCVAGSKAVAFCGDGYPASGRCR